MLQHRGTPIYILNYFVLIFRTIPLEQEQAAQGRAKVKQHCHQKRCALILFKATIQNGDPKLSPHPTVNAVRYCSFCFIQNKLLFLLTSIVHCIIRMVYLVVLTTK